MPITMYKTFNIKEKTKFVYEDIDLNLINVLSSMEANGIKVDNKYLKELSYQT